MSFCGACATWRAGHLDQTILLVWPYIHIILWMNSCHTMQPIICQKEFIKYTIFKFQLHKGGFGYRTGSAVHHQQPPCVCLFHSLVSCSNESKIEK